MDRSIINEFANRVSPGLALVKFLPTLTLKASHSNPTELINQFLTKNQLRGKKVIIRNANQESRTALDLSKITASKITKGRDAGKFRLEIFTKNAGKDASVGQALIVTPNEAFEFEVLTPANNTTPAEAKLSITHLHTAVN